MIIGICSDHAGYQYKSKLIPFLKKKGFDVRDFGTYSEESMDYPDVAHPLADAVLAWNSEIGRLVKAHNNANVLVMPARFISYDMAKRIVNIWLATPFEGGRHKRRIDKIACL